MSPILLLVMSVLFFGLFSFMWLWWCEKAKRLKVQDANDVLDAAVDGEHTESQAFRKQRDEARADCKEYKKQLDAVKFEKKESERQYAAILKDWLEAKNRFADVLQKSETDRLDARMSCQDMKAERDFHHTAHETAVTERDEMQKQLQQNEQAFQLLEAKFNDLSESNALLSAKYADLCSKIDALKDDTTAKGDFLA